jgi:hypothetical protein
MNFCKQRVFNPAWLMALAVVSIIPAAKAAPVTNIYPDFHVVVPAEKQPFPEPLPPGKEPGFKWRGSKGWAWKPEQYLAEIPYLAKFKMNFLMNCYISMWDMEHHPNWSDGQANRWWEDLPADKKAAYEQIVHECQKNGIQFCFSLNPNLYSSRLINDGSAQSVDQLYKHYAWMQGLGVKWFNLSLDDATQGVDATSQAKIVSEIFRRLRSADPGVQMIFTPSFYHGDGEAPKEKEYLQTLATALNPEVYLYWTGDRTVGKVTRRAAESYRKISGHKLFLWDNYPVNDGQQTMHLGPVVDRAPDLCAVVDGYVSNPMRKESDINRIPLATCADYAYNPYDYDPNRSIGQAILLLANTPAQRQELAELVDIYPGFLLCAGGTGYNPARAQFDIVLARPNSRAAANAYIERLQGLSARMGRDFSDSYFAAQNVLDLDAQAMLEKLAKTDTDN